MSNDRRRRGFLPVEFGHRCGGNGVAVMEGNEMKSRVIAPVFMAALQVILAATMFLVISIGWHWPYNALPGFYLIMAANTYGLTVWGYKAGKAGQ